MSANDAKRGKGEVESVSFKPLKKGGVLSSTHRVFKRGGQGGGPVHDYESEDAAHPTLESAHAHLKAMMGHAFKGEAKGDEE